MDSLSLKTWVRILLILPLPRAGPWLSSHSDATSCQLPRTPCGLVLVICLCGIVTLFLTYEGFFTIYLLSDMFEA